MIRCAALDASGSFQERSLMSAARRCFSYDGDRGGRSAWRRRPGLRAGTRRGPEAVRAQSGQAGKDVVWVPTPQALVDKMLDMAKVTPKDFVMDLGSGDGRTVITAAKRGARAMGIEYNPDMVALSEKNAAEAGVTDKATFVKADLFETDFSKATVVTMFLLPSINLKLRPKILDMKPGTRVVSNTFDMEDWEADETRVGRRDCTSWCTRCCGSFRPRSKAPGRCRRES